MFARRARNVFRHEARHSRSSNVYEVERNYKARRGHHKTVERSAIAHRRGAQRCEVYTEMRREADILPEMCATPCPAAVPVVQQQAASRIRDKITEAKKRQT